MGYATPIRAPEQVEYRLADSRDLRWVGSGLSEFGLTAGVPVDAGMARALMDGRDPNTGEQLVKRKKVLDPRGKVAAHVVVDAVRELAAADGMTAAAYLGNDRLADRFARAERGIKRDGAHVIPVADAERLAAAGLNADALYGADVIAEANRWKGHHVDVGLRGVDVTAELVKSISAASGLVDAQTAAAIEEDFLDSLHEAVTEVLEPAAAYGMAGHHGDGERAARVESSGLIGWITLHRSARPVDTASPGDPHLHAHINLAHLVHCADGAWRAPGAGGEEFHRYARLVNEVAEARLRAKLIEKYGARFELSDKGAWELVGIDQRVRTAFSRRHQKIVELVGREATRDQQKAAALKSAEAKEDVGPAAPRENWRTRAAAVLDGEENVDAMVAAALPGPGPDGPALPAGSGPRMPSPEQIAARIWDPEHGLTAAKKFVTHVHVLAAVAAAVPYLRSAEQLTELTDQVLAVDGHAVRLPDSGRTHYLHRQRYTHGTVIEAERTSTEAASDGLNAHLAQLTAEAAEMTIATMELANSTPERAFVYSGQQRGVITRLLTAGRDGRRPRPGRAPSARPPDRHEGRDGRRRTAAARRRRGRQLRPHPRHRRRTGAHREPAPARSNRARRAAGLARRRPHHRARRVGRVDVAHGGLLRDPEQPHQPERICRLGRFVQDAVLAQPGQRQPLGRHQVQRSGGDRWLVGVGSGFLGDQQVGVGGGGPAAVTVGEPVGGELVGEFFEVEGVAQQSAAHFQGAVGEAPHRLVEQRHRPLGVRPGPPVQESAEPPAPRRVLELVVAVGVPDLPGVLVRRHLPLGVPLHHRGVLHAQVLGHVRDHRPRHVQRVLQEQPQVPDRASLH
ncbi:hypothetical protein ADK86_23950 [Streptomyces sp. NRRL F-5755]|nr:hypothetical protein ADK86_23950 [Streptomyces sp. NRRL F-5755]